MESIHRYAAHLAQLMNLDEAFQQDLSKYSQLHDIGKIQVAELIRLPRKLTDEEFTEVKRHTIYGAKIVEGLDGLEMAYNIALDHHERWDGTGYPNGKKGTEISLEGRIVAIGDVFDALVSARAYKPAFSYEKTLGIFTQGDGRVMPEHFDAEILAVFIKHYDEFIEIHKELK